MTRSALETYLLQTYQPLTDHPWAKYPDYTVFRHPNRKCFAIVMTLTRDKLGLPGDEPLDVVNLKCDPALIGSLIRDPGLFPAYHMSKTHWITAALDGTVPAQQLKALVDMSFTATAPRGKGR